MTLYLEIVTPDGIVWKSDKVDSVIVPTKAGEIQIFPGHIPLVSILEAGDLGVFCGGEREDIAVDKGYVRIIADTVSIITEAAIEFKNIDEAEAQKARELAAKALEEAKNRREIDPEEIERLEATMRFAIAKQLVRKRK